jgi:hypothetical protein
MQAVKDFYNAGNYKRVEISDHVIIGGDKAHVVKLGRKYVEVLFYTGQPTRGHMKVDPFSDLIVWPGTQHN